MTCNPKWSV